MVKLSEVSAMESLTKEMLEKSRDQIYGAKVMVCVMRSTDPDKQKKIERMREIADELQRLFDEITEGIL